MEPIVIKRSPHTLVVRPRGDGFDIVVNGGGDITESEYAKISEYVGSSPDAERLLAKLRARMDR